MSALRFNLYEDSPDDPKFKVIKLASLNVLPLEPHWILGNILSQ